MKLKKLALILITGLIALQTSHAIAMNDGKFDPIIELEEIDPATQLEQAIVEGDIKLMAELQNNNAPVSTEALYALLECPNMSLVRRFFQEPINIDEITFLSFVSDVIDANYTFQSPIQVLLKKDYFNRFIIRLIGITGYCPTTFISFFKANISILSTLEKIKIKSITNESIKKLMQENLPKKFVSAELCSYLFTAAATGNYNILSYIIEPNKLLMKPVKFGSSVIQNNYKNIFPPKCNLSHTTGTPLLVRLLQVSLEFNQNVFIEKLLQLVDLTDDGIYTVVKTEVIEGIKIYKKHIKKVALVTHPSIAKRNQDKLDYFAAQQRKLTKVLASQRQHKQLMKQSNILLNQKCMLPLFDDEYCIVPGEIGLKILEYCPVRHGIIDLEKDKKNKITSWKLDSKSAAHKQAQAFLAQFITTDKK